MYRYGSFVQAGDHMTDRGGRAGIQSLYGVHNLSGGHGLFVSLSFSMDDHLSRA